MAPLTLYHRTTIADARRIAKEGFHDHKWGFQLEGPGTEQRMKLVGVWLSDRILEPDQGPPGDAVLEVTLAATGDMLQAFEVFAALQGARLWVVPAAVLNPRAQVRILSVDPRTSWWHRSPGAEGAGGAGGAGVE